MSEALNFAMVDKAPVIFVCENNGWAISTPTQLQYATTHLAGRGIGFGMPSIRVDGNDILGLLEKPLEGYLGRDETRQWLMIPKPRLTPEQQAAVRSLTFEEQWKISSIDGLESLPEVHE